MPTLWACQRYRPKSRGERCTKYRRKDSRLGKGTGPIPGSDGVATLVGGGSTAEAAPTPPDPPADSTTE
eukprot:9555563-Lingulodinium_polyedra.AAC.1